MTNVHDFLSFDIDDGEDDDSYDFILIDGMNVIHRAAHSYSELSVVTADGDIVLTGAAFGFISIVKMVWEKYARGPGDTKLVVCWDGGYQHRLQLHAGYKANRRDKKKEDLEGFQLDIPNQRKALGRILQAAGWCQAISDGFEADDVMATLAMENDGKRVAIYTMDQDLHQCVTETTHVISPQWGSSSDKIWTIEAVVEKWGVPPSRVPEVKALAGDSADDIPGCPGCGKGWAKKLLSPDVHVTALIARAQEGLLEGDYDGKHWRTPSLTKKIVENEKQILMSWELAKTVSDCVVEYTHPPQNPEHLKTAFQILRYHSFLDPATFRILGQMA